MSCEAQQKITMHVAIKSLHELKMEKMLHKMLIINPKEIRHSDVCSGNSGAEGVVDTRLLKSGD